MSELVSQTNLWIGAHRELIWWLGGISLVTFVVFLVAIPLIIMYLPRRYLQPPENAVSLYRRNLPLFIVKNAAGVLTILVGLMLASIPGKRRLIRYFLSKPQILNALNNLRKKAGTELLEAGKE